MPTTPNPRLSLGSLHGRKVMGALNGGRVSSHGGVELLAQADDVLGLTAALVSVIPDHPDPLGTRHEMV